MEKFSYTDSTGSSLRSREIDSGNPPPLDDQNKPQQQPPQSYKVKFMCSYGGKIQPRIHDNQLTYVNGETKILSVDRGIRFSVLVSKLSAFCGDNGGNVLFKYQLPGEDLDALISVTNDDDLEHMMHEYDRLLRISSSKPARMRLFLFSAFSGNGEFGSSQTNRDRSVEVLKTDLKLPESEKSVTVIPNNADFLFGSEKVSAPPPTLEVKSPIPVALEPPFLNDQRVIQPDHIEIQRQMQEVQRMQIRDQETQQYQLHQQQEAVSRRKNSEDGLGYNPPPYAQNPAQPIPQPNPQAPPMTFWQGNHNQGVVYPTTTQRIPEKPVYIIPSPYTATRYQASPPQQQGLMRPITIGQGNQGGYLPPVQRMASDTYRELNQPAYNNMAQPPVGTKVQQLPVPVSSGHPPPQYSAVPPTRQVIGLPDPLAYTQVGKQVYYTEAPPQPPQYNGIGLPVTGMNGLRNGSDGNLVAMNITPKDPSQKSDSTVGL